MTTADQVRTLLDRLGATSDAVADRLRALGIKGRRNRLGFDPLSIYLAVNGFLYARPVAGQMFYELPGNPGFDGFTQLPPAAVAFAAAFERGVYLDLCLPEGATP